MGSYTQANRPMEVLTPLGKDVLLIVDFTAQEGLSQLFHFQVDMVAENGRDIPFDKLLGQLITVRLDQSDGKKHYFNGLCNRASQGESDRDLTAYHLELVPQFWLLTRKAQSRIFQQVTVPDILKKVLVGFPVTYELQGTFHKRDYCVQYRETDFNFACRLMEEEGIFYFFKHENGKHTMVVANSPQSHHELPGYSKIYYENVEGGIHRDEDRVYDWRKVQELRSGKYLLWDHTFEKPHSHLAADKQIQDSVQVGQVTHKLKLPVQDQLEIYDWPGEYAQRFDGVDPGGGERPQDIQKIFEDNKRTVGIRMQQEALPSVVVQGTSNCRHFMVGHRFSLQTLPADKLAKLLRAEGEYVLTSIQHTARIAGGYVSGEEQDFHYHNSFTAIPHGLPYRPPRMTQKPFVQGCQTAVVVGPPGEEIFTDKYGRVKVQFHWDRDGKYDQNSSCWVRVTQPWAGKRWGASFWPRIGQEVIIDFEEGDPDRPIIVGTVYNADQMPPYQGNGPDPKHPHDNKLCGIKSNSTKGGVGFNEWRFDDTKGKEQIFVHAEKDQDIRVKNDRREWVGHDRSLIVKHDKKEEVEHDKHLHVHKNHVEKIDKNMELKVGDNQDIHVGDTKKELIGKDHHLIIGQNDKQAVGLNQDLAVGAAKKEKVGKDSHLEVGDNLNEKVGQTHSLEVGKDQQVQVAQNYALEAGQEIHQKGGQTIVLEAGQTLTIKGPGGFIVIDDSGVIIKGKLVRINSGGSAGDGSGSQPEKPEAPERPEEAKKAKPAKPDEADNSVTGQKSAPDNWASLL